MKSQTKINPFFIRNQQNNMSLLFLDDSFEEEFPIFEDANNEEPTRSELIANILRGTGFEECISSSDFPLLDINMDFIANPESDKKFDGSDELALLLRNYEITWNGTEIETSPIRVAKKTGTPLTSASSNCDDNIITKKKKVLKPKKQLRSSKFNTPENKKKLAAAIWLYKYAKHFTLKKISQAKIVRFTGISKRTIVRYARELQYRRKARDYKLNITREKMPELAKQFLEQL